MTAVKLADVRMFTCMRRCEHAMLLIIESRCIIKSAMTVTANVCMCLGSHCSLSNSCAMNGGRACVDTAVGHLEQFSRPLAATIE
jgi:hypothetical protein